MAEQGKAPYSSPMDRVWFGLGALAGLSAVAMAAVAAHMKIDPAAASAVRDAAQAQGWHAIVLLICGMRGGRWANFAGTFFALGLLMFCGGIYGKHFGGLPIGAVTPFGGVMLMIGWLMLFIGAFRKRGR
jgi:uncharacterized membrane protein YgdD (TMEM256/DUF423 family)